MIEQNFLIKSDFNINFHNHPSNDSSEDIDENVVFRNNLPFSPTNNFMNKNSLNRENDQFLDDIFEEFMNAVTEKRKVIFCNYEKLKDKEIEIDLISHSLWQIESIDRYKGGTVQWDNLYRFKHFFTGKYLSVSENENVGFICFFNLSKFEILLLCLKINNFICNILFIEN